MLNMKNIINAHNKKITNSPKDNVTRTCNCIRKHQCQLHEKCVTNNVLYKATITPNKENSRIKIYYGVSETAFKLRHASYKKKFNSIKQQTDTELSNEYRNIISANKNSRIKIYYGVSETAFKLRHVNYKKTFSNIKYQTDTELSSEYRNIISANKTSNISWKILKTHKSYILELSKRCFLCLNEKLEIALCKDDNMLNKRSEVISQLRHRNKQMLTIYESKD